jgi:hypothetical protein
MTTATTAQYRRTHGKDPRGQGTWAWQRSRTRNAYSGDTYGDTEFFDGTYTEARKQAQAAHSDAAYTACMG